MKTVFKLLIAALVINATWQFANAYISHYSFQDSVKEAALARRQTDAQLRQRIIALAADNNIPISDGDFTIRHGESHIFVEGGYDRPVPVFPGMEFPLHLAVSIDAYVLP